MKPIFHLPNCPCIPFYALRSCSWWNVVE